MSSRPKYVKFTFDWKFRWDDYDQMRRKMVRHRYYFVTSFNNVSFRWYAYMYATNDSPKVGFFMSYDDGPLEKIHGVGYKVGVVKRDQSLRTIRKAITDSKEYLRGATTNGVWGWRDFENKDSTIVRTKYGLTESDRLTYQITIKIPTPTFAYCYPSPTPAPSTPWLVKLFDSIISNNEGDSSQSDVKIAGRDGIVFNCHKLIVTAQSKALKTIFHYPPTREEFGVPTLEDGEQPVRKKRKASATIGGGVYKFPNLCVASLKSVLEYLYTGNVTTSILTVTELIEVGDAGEQYDLKTLKEFSAAELWKRVIIEEPLYAFEIARFSDLHDELKYLKHRALDVIAENFDRLGLKAKKLAKRFGGTNGEELHNELMEYAIRRLRPIFKE